MSRPLIEQYALSLAEVVATRSEDIYRPVGAVAINKDKRVIATGYNGFMPGFKLPPEIENDRETRLKYMLHAEVNMCSLFTRDEIAGGFVAITHLPCGPCLNTLLAHGVTRIVYRHTYERDLNGLEIADLYNIALEQWLPVMTMEVPEHWGFLGQAQL